jgi:hypothetical protein
MTTGHPTANKAYDTMIDATGGEHAVRTTCVIEAMTW